MNLTALLKTLQAQKAKLQTEITRLEQAIASLTGLSGRAKPGPKPGKKRGMSAAGRRAIAAAQRKRWAAHKAAKAADKPARKKRKMSAAGRAAIVAAVKARWAKVKAAQKKAAKVQTKGPAAKVQVPF